MTAQRNIDDAQEKLKNISDSTRWFKNQLHIEQNKRFLLEGKIRRLEREITKLKNDRET